MNWFVGIVMLFVGAAVFRSMFEPTPLASPSDSVDRLD